MQKKQRKPAGKRKKSAAAPTSKKDQMIELLKRPTGATLDDLMSTSGWQAHSVRGFLSGAVSKGLGMRVDSSKQEDGQRVYRIACLSGINWSPSGVWRGLQPLVTGRSPNSEVRLDQRMEYQEVAEKDKWEGRKRW